MNKKGDELTIVMVLEMLVVVFIGYLAFGIGTSFGERDTIFKTTTVEDIRMMIDTLVAIPGDAQVQYPEDVSKYTLILDNNHVALFKSGEMEDRWIKRYFSLPEGYTATGIIEQKSSLCLKKEAKTILLSECRDSE